MIKKICLKKLFITFLFITLIFTSCTNKKQEKIVLWTDNVEFASYAELYNSTQDKIKLAVVYKSDIIDSLLQLKKTKLQDSRPDIIAGSYIDYGIEKRLFARINGVFSDELQETDFYPNLLEYGAKNNSQYLLPVNFNLGTIVYDNNNSSLLDETNTITFDQIKEISKTYNKQNKDNIYTKMAFAPQWNADFLYSYLSASNVTFSQENEKLIFNIKLFDSTCNELIQWTKDFNSSCNDEKDFAFKYLYTPFYKQVLQDKSLFAYTTSDKILSLNEDDINKINFKYLITNSQAIVQEDICMIGVYKKSNKKRKCYEFFRWFFNKDSQEKMLDRRLNMNLDTNTFGIANGFSSLIRVNEQVLPVYYKALLGKTPTNTNPSMPTSYSKNWELVKEEVLIPHLIKQVEGKTSSYELATTYTEWVNSNKEE